VSSVQNDIWTLLAVLAVGVVPLGVVLFMLRRPRPFEPSGGKGPSAAREALFENEAYTFKEEPVEGIPGDSPLTWWRRALYEAAVLGGGLSLSMAVLWLARQYCARG
jgi:hypothetical protein